MRRLIVEPNGWSCEYGEAPPGHILLGEQLCFKSEYRNAEGRIEGYNSSGEFLCIAPNTLVQPVETKWVDEDA